MRYWGRATILHLAIIITLYGTREIWDKHSYERYLSGAPSHTTFGYEPQGYQGSVEIGGLEGQAFGQQGGTTI